MKCVPSQARQKYFKKKFIRKEKNMEANSKVLDLTSKLEDRELERIMKIKRKAVQNQNFK